MGGLFVAASILQVRSWPWRTPQAHGAAAEFRAFGVQGFAGLHRLGFRVLGLRAQGLGVKQHRAFAEDATSLACGTWSLRQTLKRKTPSNNQLAV